MKPITKLIAVTFFLCFAVSMLDATVYAEIPRQMTYQGKLVDKNGNPIDQQAVSVTFRIYNSTTQPMGDALWSETQSITPKKGMFNTILGQTNPINLPFDAQYYLGIQVGTDTEMTPRMALASSAYAFNSERLGGKAITEFSLASHAHDASDINEGIVPVERGGTGESTKTTAVIQYTGNGIDNRIIAHGLGITPSVIIVSGASTDDPVWIWTPQMNSNESKYFEDSGIRLNIIKAADATNITLGTSPAGNGSGKKYTMICFGKPTILP